MFDKSQNNSIIGAQLRTTDGTKVGKIGQVYLDDHYDAPEWITVNTGLFGTDESFVPLAEASLDDGAVTVPYGKDQIKNAPSISSAAELSEEQERELYEYYGVAYTTEGSTFAKSGVHESADAVGDSDPAAARAADRETGVVGGPSTDDTVTRSEERLNVGTEQAEQGRARLRKYVKTENVTQTVPVKREVAEVVREPITDADRGDGSVGISEQEHEVTLNEERVVVSKETVPVERVRLDKKTVTDQKQVDETVRKEQIDTDGVESERR